MPVRRRVLRRPAATTTESARQARLAKKRFQLESEQATLGRWMTKLIRAFHVVEKQQRKVARLGREIAKLDQAERPR